MGMSMDQISEHLAKHNVKPSHQRVKVMEYLVTRQNHPTVEQIYHELVRELPTLSKTTVYNTLNIFIQANIVRLISIEDNETRYDADISDHGHFKCEECGRIFDFTADIQGVEAQGLQGFKIKEKNIYFKGVCPNCLVNINHNKN